MEFLEVKKIVLTRKFTWITVPTREHKTCNTQAIPRRFVPQSQSGSRHAGHDSP